MSHAARPIPHRHHRGRGARRRLGGKRRRAVRVASRAHDEDRSRQGCVLPGAGGGRRGSAACRRAAGGDRRARRQARIRRSAVRLRNPGRARGSPGRGPHRRVVDRRGRRRGRRSRDGRPGARPSRSHPARRASGRERRGDQTRRCGDRPVAEPDRAVGGAAQVRQRRFRARAQAGERRDGGLDHRAARDRDEDG